MAKTATRSERLVRLYRTLGEEVARVAPAGLGYWDDAWRIVAEPSRRLLDVGSAFERGEASGGDVLATARAVRAAWEEAAERWRAADRPTTWTAETAR